MSSLSEKEKAITGNKEIYERKKISLVKGKYMVKQWIQPLKS